MKICFGNSECRADKNYLEPEFKMKQLSITILLIISFISAASAQQEITIGYRRISVFNPTDPGGFSVQVGKTIVKTADSTYVAGFSEPVSADSEYAPLDNVCGYLQSDTIDIPAGTTKFSFETVLRLISSAG